MAHHVPHILNEVLSPEYRFMIDESGLPLKPSDKVYDTISEKISNDEYSISAKYIYVILQKNRYQTWDKILEYHNFEVRDNSKLDDSELDASLKHRNLNGEIAFNLHIPYKTWVIMTPEELRYTDRVLSERNYTVLTRKVWTDTLFELLWEQTDVPCPFSFKRCKLTETGIYLKVAGSCGECGSSFLGMIANKPPARRDVTMECIVENFDDSVLHNKKRQLKGQRRIDVSTKMVESNILPCIWRRNEADKLMEFGDREPAHLPKTSVVRKAKQERQNIQFGLKGKDPIENLCIMKYDRHAGTIHSIGVDPLFVHYWTPQQVAIYLDNSERISVDGTGSLIKKMQKPTGELCPHIYLYQIVAETAESKVPVFQMLSASQNTSSVCYWLNEIVRIGSQHKSNFPLPKQVVCDFDKALMGGVVRVFGQCSSLKDYLSKCFDCLTESSNQLPSCFLRLDVSHYVHMICRWEMLSKIHPLARTLYIMVMSHLTKVTDFDEFQDIVRSTIILCKSPEYGSGMDDLPCLAQEAFNRLRRIVRGDPGPIVKLLMDHTDVAKTEALRKVTTDGPQAVTTGSLDEATKEEFQAPQTENETDNNMDDVDDIPLMLLEWAATFYEECEEAANEGQLTRKGEDGNPYYAPDVAKKIKSLLNYFPVYTGIMIPVFGFGTPTATSSAVEGEFNDVKHRLLHAKPRPIRIDKFVDNHVNSFSGRMKLAKSEEYASQKVDVPKVADSDEAEPSVLNKAKAAKASKGPKAPKATKAVKAPKAAKVGKTPLENGSETRPTKLEKRSVIADRRQGNSRTDKSDTSVIETVSEKSDTGLFSPLKCASPVNNESDEQTNDVVTEEPVDGLNLSDAKSITSVAESFSKKGCYSEKNGESSIEESHELTFEHNWRNKNEPAVPRKGRKRKYLDPHPELGIATLSRKRKAVMSLLPNGNLCPSFKAKRKRFVVTNTCGFDSILQLLVAACIHDKFNQVVETASSDVFQFTKKFEVKGPCAPIYKERARLIGKVQCFVEEKNPGVVTIDALSNICNLCEWIFSEEASYDIRRDCLTCQKVTTKSNILVQLDFETIQNHGYGQLENAIKLQNSRQWEKTCANCNTELRIQIDYRHHLFVECIGAVGVEFQLKSFPRTITLNECTYSLAGVVHFRPGRTIKIAGHYSAFARYGDDWVLFDDLCTNTKRVTEEAKVNPVLCVYVET